jgi:hypothetical protein
LPRTVDDDRDPPEILKAADVHRRSRILRGGFAGNARHAGEQLRGPVHGEFTDLFRPQR